VVSRAAISKEIEAYKKGNKRIKSKKQAIAIAYSKDKKKNKKRRKKRG
jgi:hypothetical protein